MVWPISSDERPRKTSEVQSGFNNWRYWRQLKGILFSFQPLLSSIFLLSLISYKPLFRFPALHSLKLDLLCSLSWGHLTLFIPTSLKDDLTSSLGISYHPKWDKAGSNQMLDFPAASKCTQSMTCSCLGVRVHTRAHKHFQALLLQRLQAWVLVPTQTKSHLLNKITRQRVKK